MYYLYTESTQLIKCASKHVYNVIYNRQRVLKCSQTRIDIVLIAPIWLMYSSLLETAANKAFMYISVVFNQTFLTVR